MNESFQKELAALRALGPEVFVLRGSTLIVEILEQEIKTKSGIVLVSDDGQRKGGTVAAHKVDVGRVLMVGEGYWVEGSDGEAGRYEAVACQPGAVVLLPQFSTQLVSHFPGINRPTNNKLGMIKMDSILGYYPTEEAYNIAVAKLNE